MEARCKERHSLPADDCRRDRDGPCGPGECTLILALVETRQFRDSWYLGKASAVPHRVIAPKHQRRSAAQATVLKGDVP